MSRPSDMKTPPDELQLAEGPMGNNLEVASQIKTTASVAEGSDTPGVVRAADNADDWWRSCAEAALDHLAASGQPFTAPDLTAMGVPDPDHANRWGALFRRAAQRGQIVAVGYAPSPRASRAGGVCRVWRGVTSHG